MDTEQTPVTDEDLQRRDEEVEAANRTAYRYSDSCDRLTIAVSGAGLLSAIVFGIPSFVGTVGLVFLGLAIISVIVSLRTSAAAFDRLAYYKRHGGADLRKSMLSWRRATIYLNRASGTLAAAGILCWVAARLGV